jgi:hypothetical protein
MHDDDLTPTVEHQPREHSVRCFRHHNETWNWQAKCAVCLIEDCQLEDAQ